MEIKTYEDLIEWARQLHLHLSRCFSECAKNNPDERASALLDYLAGHEAEIGQMTAEFEKQTEEKVLKTRLYDYYESEHRAIRNHGHCDDHYAGLDFDTIAREVFEFHDQLTELYKSLNLKAEIPEASDLVESLREMEENESMRLARQIGAMNDV
ncbi:ATPase [Marinobacter sp.]|uniref:ATPase n=1 Tax=Marinobacter sp. TaxID=50741 RepID=UPI002B4A8655|nr:ATPase [Marinobacter sp.]HKK57132.1 ATPase [Marinobacter sp.]